MKLTDQQIEFLKELDKLCKRFNVRIGTTGYDGATAIYNRHFHEIERDSGGDWVIDVDEKTIGSQEDGYKIHKIENFPEGIEL